MGIACSWGDFMFVTLKLKKLVMIIVAVLLIAAVILFAARIKANNTAAFLTQSRYTLVIDPGHGGIDGGAIAKSGTKESDINLTIALKMRALAEFLGQNYVMTRDTDTDNSGDEKYSEHDNLVKRAELTNSTPDAVLISVHQNNYPSPLVKGAEVMYSLDDKSRELGLITQDNLITYLDPENRRVARPAPESLLLTSSVNCPAVLVECGFMSNPDEAEKLTSNEYTTKIAAILIGSYMQFEEKNI